MSALERLWSKLARFAEAWGDMDAPIGDYMSSLGKRVDKLERDVERLESRLHSGAGGGEMQRDSASKI